QKMVLNMLTTGTMIRLGKTFGNLMVDVQPSNAKLRDRAVRIVAAATGVSEADAPVLLRRASNDVKTAIVMSLLGLDAGEASRRLDGSGGVIRNTLGERS